MDRRLFLAGLLGVSATTAVASLLPRQAKAMVGVPPRELDTVTDDLPNLTNPEPDTAVPDSDWEDNVELAFHEGRPHRRRRRRRRRVRRWRRECRRRWYNGAWRRRCRRVPYWAWIWFWI
jgi:hypothetical protein